MVGLYAHPIQSPSPNEGSIWRQQTMPRDRPTCDFRLHAGLICRKLPKPFFFKIVLKQIKTK